MHIQRGFAYAVVLWQISCGAALAEVEFVGDFKVPAQKRLWQALNQPTAGDFELVWKGIGPEKDVQRPEDFWHQWPLPFSAFYAGIKIPADQFILASLYQNGKLFYPQAQYEACNDYCTFFDLHESLAWLYAFDSPANPYFGNRALRLRAQQLALSHLIGMVQEVPGGNIIGGWPIQYGNCLAWNAHVLRLLDHVEPIEPELKSAWLDCLRHIATTLDGQGPEVLQTPMGHWNLWPVCGAFQLWRASGDPRDRALFEKWAKVQLTPDAFTSQARYVSGTSPCGYVRYGGIDLSYNGQAKNWMAPLFAYEDVDSIVGDFARRQYRFASFATLEEPNGSLSSLQHMNSHSSQAVPYEQWAAHKHLAYAMKLPDAVPFAVHAGYSLAKIDGITSFVERQRQMEQMKVTVRQMEFGVRSYPSNYLHLPPCLSDYPDTPPADLSVRTRPMEHLAYAQWFQSPVVHDEFFMRRMPAYHATIYSGPCKDAVSNAGGRLNGIGAGGLGQLWVANAGTMWMAATDLSQKPAMDGDFDEVWSQLAINGMVVQQVDGKVVCTGWTGSRIQSYEAQGRCVIIRGESAPEVQGSYGTPMTKLAEWTRRINFSGSGIKVQVSIVCEKPLQRIAELIPVALFSNTIVSAVGNAGDTINGPWPGRKKIREIIIRRGRGAVQIVLRNPLEVSWGALETPLAAAVGQRAVARSLRLWLEPGSVPEVAELVYDLKIDSGESTDVEYVFPCTVLPEAKVNQEYRIALEPEDGLARYWQLAGGAIPPGLTLQRNGLLSGTARTSGTYKFDLLETTPYKDRPFFLKDRTARDLRLTVRP
jgi:hypothetical protein